MRSVVIGIDDSDAAAVRSPRSRQVSGRIRPRSRVGAAQYRGSVSDRPPGLDNYPGWCGTRERLKCLMRAARTTAIPIHAAAISARSGLGSRCWALAGRAVAWASPCAGDRVGGGELVGARVGAIAGGNALANGGGEGSFPGFVHP